jgi:Ni/Co efflux regulator RcnB
MKRLLIGLAAASAAAITFAATAASAEVVCNRAGECWHVDRHYHYDRGVGVVVHPDDWYFHQHWDDKHRWRDYHEGRGYYRDGIWIPF